MLYSSYDAGTSFETVAAHGVRGSGSSSRLILALMPRVRLSVTPVAQLASRLPNLAINSSVVVMMYCRGSVWSNRALRYRARSEDSHTPEHTPYFHHRLKETERYNFLEEATQGIPTTKKHTQQLHTVCSWRQMKQETLCAVTPRSRQGRRHWVGSVRRSPHVLWHWEEVGGGGETLKNG